jgi:alkylation response protein AidB-like acyl-CoA dehydrogenase
MKVPEVDVRPLRQITGEAEFNEIFLNEVRVADACRLGDVGEGWRVAMTTLNNERVAIGGAAVPRESGLIGIVADRWRTRPEQRTAGLHDRLLRLWIDAEVFRLAGERSRQRMQHGQPGPESAALKLMFARTAQAISGLEIEIAGDEALRYHDWTMRRSDVADFTGRDPGYRYLRAKGNSIEGGTSEVLRNVIAERVLGMPAEPRTDKTIPWKDLPR